MYKLLIFKLLDGGGGGVKKTVLVRLTFWDRHVRLSEVRVNRLHHVRRLDGGQRVKRVDQRVRRNSGSGSRRRRQDAVAGSADGGQAAARCRSSRWNLYGMLPNETKSFERKQHEGMTT